jgi:hypothetical protein
MIIEDTFLFHGQPRWTLGWATPNYGGAFAATVLCLFWSLRAWNRRWQAGLIAAEGSGLWLISKTYSRGALLAIIVAAVFFLVVSGRKHIREVWKHWILRLAILATCVLATGFGPRLQPSEVVDDGAVINRLTLWRGGLQMIASAPFAGWGSGESGRAYMNWFQDTARVEPYTTMVNSYLHVAVEHGLPVLGCVFFVMGMLLTVAWDTARHYADSNDAIRVAAISHDVRLELAYRRLVAALGASLVAWAVANAFSTLWIEPRLWIPPAIASLLIVLGGLRLRRMNSRFVMWNTGMALFAILSLYVAGVCLAHGAIEKISPRACGTVVVQRPGAFRGQKAIWHVWPDVQVIGPTPGKELRRWLARQPDIHCLVVHSPNETNQRTPDDGIQGMLLMGRQIERLQYDSLPQCQRLCLVHPLGAPMTNRSGLHAHTMILILPGIDEAGNSIAWRRWANAVGAGIRKSADTGLDIRAAWPDVALFASSP